MCKPLGRFFELSIKQLASEKKSALESNFLNYPFFDKKSASMLNNRETVQIPEKKIDYS